MFFSVRSVTSFFLHPSASSPSTHPQIMSEQPAAGSIRMSKSQKHVLRLVDEGKNVFFTGSAGVGKSFVIEEIRKLVEGKGLKLCTTSYTGTAALNVRGVTLHSFSGVGTDRSASIAAIKNNIIYNPNQTAHENWLTTDVLIIDEISMVSKAFFEDLCNVACIIRERPTALFGGIQLIVCGDFYQLPPISSAGQPKEEYCFQSPLWSKIFPETGCVQFTKIFRQTNPEFKAMLNRVRVADLDQHVQRYFNRLDRKFECPEGITPIMLYCTKKDVDQENLNHLVRIKGEERKLVAEDFNPNKMHPEAFDKLFMAQKLITLRVGCQVILLKNWKDHGLVNGSVGIVTGFGPAGNPIVDFKDEDGESIVAGGSDVPGQKGIVVPKFRFTIEKGRVITAARVQTPLSLAYAFTVHKSQGMTLNFLEIDLQSVFAPGQAYVALSRAVSPSTLRVKNFDYKKLKHNQIVTKFYNALSENQQVHDEDEEGEDEDED